VQPLRAAMRDETNELVVSAASIWEIAIKRAIGKLRFDRPIVATVVVLGFEILAVTESHAEHAGGLLRHHMIRSIPLSSRKRIWKAWYSAPRIGGCGPTRSPHWASASQHSRVCRANELTNINKLHRGR
jgi:hypothetical protein